MKKARYQFAILLALNTTLVVSVDSQSQDTDVLVSEFRSIFTPLENVIDTTCAQSREFPKLSAALSVPQFDLLRDLYIAAELSGHPNWAHLAVEGSHYWNASGFVNYMKPLLNDQVGIVYVYKLPFAGNQRTTAEWAWDSATDIEHPDIEMHIKWCRPLDSGGGVRTSGSLTYLVEQDGEWKLFPP